MANEFDYKSEAAALAKRIREQGNPDLMRLALEVALRDAYQRGMADARATPARATTPARAVSASRPSSAPRDVDPTETCEHRWRESFLDGHAVGNECERCGVLERSLQTRCNHYFVKAGKQEVCVACRATRPGR